MSETDTALVRTEPPATTMAPWSALDAKLAFCARLLESGLLPLGLKTAGQVLAVVQTGQELGIPPMHALRSIQVVQGKPTLSAELMMALMLKGGVKFEWLKDSSTECVLKATRPDGTSYTGKYTWAEATTAGLTSKPVWKQYPAAMLRARVISLVARVIAPDMVSGVYTPEELEGVVETARVLPCADANPYSCPPESHVHPQPAAD